MTTKRNSKSKNTEPLPDYPNGMKVTLVVGGNEVQGEFSHWTKHNEAYIKVKEPNGTYKAWWRKSDKFTPVDESIDFDSIDHAVSQGNGETEIVPITLFKKPIKEFDINTRFDFLGSLVNMVIKGQQVSLIITGDGGLGKTKTVNDHIEAAGLIEGETVYTVKGYSTAKGLYNTLFENSDKLIIFDDCDEVLTNSVATNILKGALDSYDKRVVHWISNVVSEDIPPYFEFSGRIIFISNMPRTKIPQTLQSRATLIDVSMNMKDKMERMKRILPLLRKDVSLEKKQESLRLLDKWKENCKDLNFRTLLKIISIRTSGVKDWRNLAEYMILNG